MGFGLGLDLLCTDVNHVALKVTYNVNCLAEYSCLNDEHGDFLIYSCILCLFIRFLTWFQHCYNFIDCNLCFVTNVKYVICFHYILTRAVLSTQAAGV